MDESSPEDQAAQRRRRAAEQEARALAAIEAIRSGADITDESLRLANEYTDAQTARFGEWLKKVFRRR